VEVSNIFFMEKKILARMEKWYKWTKLVSMKFGKTYCVEFKEIYFLL